MGCKSQKVSQRANLEIENGKWGWGVTFVINCVLTTNLMLPLDLFSWCSPKINGSMKGRVPIPWGNRCQVCWPYWEILTINLYLDRSGCYFTKSSFLSTKYTNLGANLPPKSVREMAPMILGEEKAAWLVTRDFVHDTRLGSVWKICLGNSVFSD